MSQRIRSLRGCPAANLMPVLKSSLNRLSPAKLYGGPVTLQKEIILGSRMAEAPNPFEEDMITETSPRAKEKNPFYEGEEEEEGGPEGPETVNRNPQLGEATSPKKAINEKGGTLTSSLKKVWELGKKKVRSPTEEKGEEKKSLFKLLSPALDQDSPWKSQEKRKSRRQSEELASPPKLGNGPEKETPADPESKKKLLFPKRGKVKAETLPEQQKEVPKVKEPLSVLEINSLIQKRELVTANSHIIELEEECDRVKQQSPEGANASKDSGRKEKDVALLYAALESELERIVAESLGQAPTATAHLEQLVQTIEAEEAADRAWAQRGGAPGGPEGGRPRELRRKWREAVKGSAAERLSHGQGNGPIDQCLRNFGERIVRDLIVVRKNLIPAYPKDYEVFNVYVRSYHEELSSCLSEIGQRQLGIQDIYSFLQWCHNDYFRDVMGHVEITAHIRKQQLGPLLPMETAKRLEDDCVSIVETQITKSMAQELSAEQEKWNQGSEMFHSELANRVIQLLTGHVEKSAATTEELGTRVALCCLCSLADFLHSFQTSVLGFYEQRYENSGSTERLVPQTIALVNVCPAFRDYIERLAQKVSSGGEEGKKKAMVSLDRVIRGGNKLLMEKLFEELKPNVSKLLKKKWLQSSESFDSTLAILKQNFNQFRKMKTPPYQELVNAVHRHMVTEYLRAVLQVRITCNSSEMRRNVAERLTAEGTSLKELFESLNSTASWLDSAIESLAEIIKLKDTSSIQMEVAALVDSYPDVRKIHISAVLNVRGDVSQANRQSILATLQDFDSKDGAPTPCRDRALFAEIDAMPDLQCMNIRMYRSQGCRPGCFSMFRRHDIHTR
ncbi:exocyst complex component 3-like protein 2 [Mustelus asterias]